MNQCSTNRSDTSGQNIAHIQYSTFPTYVAESTKNNNTDAAYFNYEFDLRRMRVIASTPLSRKHDEMIKINERLKKLTE